MRPTNGSSSAKNTAYAIQLAEAPARAHLVEQQEHEARDHGNGHRCLEPRYA